MANPTLITGFEDVLTYIRQQDERIKRLEEENEKLAGKAKKAIELHNLVSKMANEDNASLQKQIDELQKENKEYEFESCESVVASQKVYGQAFAIQAERDKLQKENDQLEEENKKLKDQLNFIFPSKEEQNVIAKYQVDRTNRLREIKKLKEELLYYRFSTYTLDRGGDCDLTKEDVDNFTDEEALRKTLYERIGYEEDQ